MDFTGVLQMRQPYEMGGGYFSLTLFSTPIVCLYMGSRYLAFVEDKSNEDGTYLFTSEQVYGTVFGLVVL